MSAVCAYSHIVEVVLTFCRPQIAEWVIGAYLSHQHHFHVYAEQQKQQLWRPRLELGVQVSTGRRM